MNNNKEIDLSDYAGSEPDKENRTQASSSSSSYSGDSKLVALIIKGSGGLVVNEDQASYVLLVFVILVIVATMFLIFGTVEQPVRQEEYAPDAMPNDLK